MITDRAGGSKSYNLDDAICEQSFIEILPLWTKKKCLLHYSKIILDTLRIYAKGDLQILDNEWRAIDTSVIPEHLRNSDSTKEGTVYFYQELAKVEFDSQLPFKNLSIFALSLLALLVSNADAEKLFFQIVKYQNS